MIWFGIFSRDIILYQTDKWCSLFIIPMRWVLIWVLPFFQLNAFQNFLLCHSQNIRTSISKDNDIIGPKDQANIWKGQLWCLPLSFLLPTVLNMQPEEVFQRIQKFAHCLVTCSLDLMKILSYGRFRATLSASAQHCIILKKRPRRKKALTHEPIPISISRCDFACLRSSVL